MLYLYVYFYFNLLKNQARIRIPSFSSSTRAHAWKCVGTKFQYPELLYLYIRSEFCRDMIGRVRTRTDPGGFIAIPSYLLLI